MKFNIGDIVTGIEHTPYAYTTNRALMVVVNTFDAVYDDIRVKLINTEILEGQQNEFNVNSDYFKLTTVQEFMLEHPNAILDQKSLLELDLKEVNLDYTDDGFSPATPFVLDETTREALIAESIPLLEEYDYHPKKPALNILFDEWAKNKGNLIRLLEKHPNYNGKFQIVFDHEYERQFDKRVISDFCYWLEYEVNSSYYLGEPMKFHGFTFREIRNIYKKMDQVVDYFHDFNYPERVIYNGKTYKEYQEEKVKFYNYYEEVDDLRMRENLLRFKENLYPSEVKAKKMCMDRMLNFIQKISKSTLDKYDAEYINEGFPEAKCKQGQKVSRAVNKCLTLLGIDKHPDYQKQFAKFADAVNPIKIKRHTIISVHPVDFWTMSFGNSWASCHTIDKKNVRRMENSYHGQYSSGTESYMLDGSTIMLYTVDQSYNGNEYELQPKINRCLFHYAHGKLIQGRVYPQSNDDGADGLYANIRNIVQEALALCLGVPNLWTLKNCESINEGNLTVSSGTHYKDYIHYETCTLSLLKDHSFNREKIYIGHNPICPCCGKLHNESENIECNNCNDND